MAVDPNVIDMGLPPEYQAIIDEAQRKRAMADALMKQSAGFQGAESKGKIAARTSPLAWLANAATGYFANAAGTKAQQDARAAQGDFQNAQNTEFQRLQGLPEEDFIAQGASSKYPLVQQEAKARRDARQKRMDALIPIVGNRDPNIAVGMAQQNKFPTQAIPPKLETVNNQRVPENQQGDFSDTWSEPFRMAGADGKIDLYKRNMRTNEVKMLDNSPKANVTVTNAAQKAGFEAWAKKAVDRVDGMAEGAQSAIGLRNTLAQLKELDAKGVSSGVLVDPMVWTANLFQSLGVDTDPAKLGNSETYKSLAREATQQLIGQYGGNKGLTETEAKQVREIIPQLQASPQARTLLTQILERAADRKIANYQKASAGLAAALKTEDPTKLDFTDVMVPPQAVPSNPVPALPLDKTRSKKTVRIEDLTDTQRAELLQLLQAGKSK